MGDNEGKFDPLRPGRRKGDSDALTRFSSFVIKYHWILTVILAFFLALGFGFQTPAAIFAEIHSSIDTLRITTDFRIKDLKEQVDAAKQERAEITNKLDNALILLCLGSTKENIRLSRVRCLQLLQDRGINP